MTNTDSTYVKTSFEKGPAKEIIIISGCMLSLAYIEVYVLGTQADTVETLIADPLKCGPLVYPDTHLRS